MGEFDNREMDMDIFSEHEMLSYDGDEIDDFTEFEDASTMSTSLAVITDDVQEVEAEEVIAEKEVFDEVTFLPEEIVFVIDKSYFEKQEGNDGNESQSASSFAQQMQRLKQQTEEVGNGEGESEGNATDSTSHFRDVINGDSQTFTVKKKFRDFFG